MKLLITILLLISSYITLGQDGWNDVTPANTYPGLFGIYVLNSENVWVVGDEGTILNTTNKGTDWIEINCPVSYSLYNVHFVSADTGWIGGDNESITEIIRTTDGGSSWELKTLYSASDLGNYDIEFIEGDSGEPPRGFVTAGRSFVWRTDDYGDNWGGTGIDAGCGAADIQSICFIDKDEGWFVGTPALTSEVTILHTTDGGDTYEIQTNPTDPDIKLNCVSFADNQHGVAVGQNSTILYTSDGGQNWETRPNSGYRWQSVYLTQSGKAWAVGDKGRIDYSTDFGYTWEPQVSGVSCELWEVFFINDNEGWIVGGGIGQPGVILHTTNGGVITGVKDNNLVSDFKLLQNYPNPFNPTTKIKYTISNAETHGYIAYRQISASVQLNVYDILGREVATLVNETKQPGEYEIELDATNLPSGIYFYQLKVGSFVQTKKMVFIK